MEVGGNLIGIRYGATLPPLMFASPAFIVRVLSKKLIPRVTCPVLHFSATALALVFEILRRAATHRFRPLFLVIFFFTTNLLVIAPVTNVSKIDQTPFLMAFRMQARAVRGLVWTRRVPAARMLARNLYA